MFDLEMMEEIGFCKGIENPPPRHLTGRRTGQPPPIDGILPEALPTFVDESHVTVPQIGWMFKVIAREEEAVDLTASAFRRPSTTGR